jgi:FkbM family methyltransferase
MIPFVGTLRFILSHPLNRNAKVRALGRFFRWQIATRVMNVPVVVPYVNGTRLLVSRGMAGATGNIYTGLHEFSDMAFAGHYLRSGDLFIDVGANVGTYSVLAAACGAAVVAFEPARGAFQSLCTNVKINSLDARITLRAEAAGSLPNVVAFTTTEDTGNHVALAGEGGALVKVVRIDDERFDFAGHCLMKIDVEGFEAQVIDGATKLLESGRVKAAIVELNGSSSRYGMTDDEVDMRMRKFGFETYAYDVPTRTLRSATRGKEGNTLYVRDVVHVAERLRSASSLNVLGQEV